MLLERLLDSALGLTNFEENRVLHSQNTLVFLTFLQPHYVASTHSILLTSTVHRSQVQNIDECLQKVCLH